MKMDWTKDHVLQLIDLVKRRPCLYNIEHESFLNKKERLRAAADLSKIISHTRPGTTIEEVLKKWDELCANFLSKHEHILLSRRGAVTRPYYYDKMSFVLDYISPKPSPKLLLEKRDEKEIRSPVKSLFEKDKSIDEEKMCTSTRDKMLETPPAEPAEVSKCSPPGVQCPTLASDEESSFSYQSHQPSPNVASSLSLPVQTRATSDALSTPMRDLFISRDVSGSSQLNLDAKVDEDEDMLYMKYILCRLKKLDEAQKVQLKFEIDKLFYQVLSPR